MRHDAAPRGRCFSRVDLPRSSSMADAASSAPIPGRRLLFAMLVVFLCAVLPAVVVPTLMCRPESPELADLGEVPAFALTDERGQPFTEDAFRGHETIISFIFTRCDTICPITTMKMERIQEKTADAGAGIKLVSFSVDPTYDTPERLTEFAVRYHADATRWRFVTGALDTVHKLVEGPFMNSMQLEGKTPSGAPAISHSGYFLLVDDRLHIRGVYDSNDLRRLDEMIRDARHLLRTRR
jgi:protein SCO1/2